MPVDPGGQPVNSSPDDQLFVTTGYASFHDVDTEAEVDAAFRIQRRIAVGYFAVFLIGVLGLALGTVRSSWATTGRILGGFSPSFLMAAIGLYCFFVIIGLAAASLANGVDRTMLGASTLAASDHGNGWTRLLSPIRSFIRVRGRQRRGRPPAAARTNPNDGRHR